jgi:hypothetical protein
VSVLALGWRKFLTDFRLRTTRRGAAPSRRSVTPRSVTAGAPAEWPSCLLALVTSWLLEQYRRRRDVTGPCSLRVVTGREAPRLQNAGRIC